MMNKTLSKVIAAIENCGWIVHKDSDGIEIENWSPKGENIVYFLRNGALLDDLRNIVENYDPDKHVVELIIAKENGLSGVPCASALVYDAEKIDDMLTDLLHAVQEVLS